MTDHTHDLRRRSWVPSADGHAEFPIQNLPLGVLSPAGQKPRGGVAIGDFILDLGAALERGLFSGAAKAAAEAAAGSRLNPFLALGAGARRALRNRLVELLDADSAEGKTAQTSAKDILHKASDCTIHLPALIGDYTDFYAGIHHATNAGRQFRPDNPLLPNYKHIPIGYHGRASSIRPSGTTFRRPSGQRKPATQEVPDFGPARSLDFELEMGIWIGPGNALGEPIRIGEAGAHIAGYCLLNDWSARDIQGWEYVPLGPFLAKNFCSTISAWIVTPEALEPFRIAQSKRPDGDPTPLPYLMDDQDQGGGALDVGLEVLLLTPAMRAKGEPPFRLTRGNARHLYWTPAQLVTHHTCGGCDLRPGDLLGTGTISSDQRDGFGSLLEITEGGKKPLTLPNGEERKFLQDGDEIIMRAFCTRDGFARIGFGDCRGTVSSASG